MAFTAYRELGYIGYAKQTVQGTPVAPSKFAKYLRAGFNIDQTMSHYRDPNSRDNTYSLKERINYRGSFQIPWYVDEAAAWLAFGMGLDTLSGGADPYTHTITLIDNPPLVTVELGSFEDLTSAPTISGIIERVQDCMVNGLTIDAVAQKPVLLTVDLMGITGAATPIVSPATVTYTDTSGMGPACFFDGAFTLVGPKDATVLQAQITKFQIAMKQNVAAVFANNIVPIGLVAQARDFDFSMSAVFATPAPYSLAHFGSTQYGGTATAATATTLTDSGAAFIASNGLANWIVMITGGTGVGQKRVVTTNTATVLTTAAWTVTPDTTSTYIVYKATPDDSVGTGTFAATFTPQPTQASPVLNERSILFTCGALDWKAGKINVDPGAGEAMIDLTAKPRKSGATLPLACVAKNSISAAY